MDDVVDVVEPARDLQLDIIDPLPVKPEGRPERGPQTSRHPKHLLSETIPRSDSEHLTALPGASPQSSSLPLQVIQSTSRAVVMFRYQLLRQALTHLRSQLPNLLHSGDSILGI